jgi:hypothetical protein
VPTTEILHQTDAGSELAQARLRLGEAVLGPDKFGRKVDRVWLLGADHERIGDPIHLAEAIDSGLAYMGKIDSGVLSLDGDPTEPGKARATEGLQVVINKLRGLGIEPVVLNSGRPGHYHLFARCGPHIRDYVGKLAQSYDISVRKDNALIRLPLAPYYDGQPVSLVQPATVEQAITALWPWVRRPPNTTMQRLIDTGESSHNSNSERFQSICLSLYQYGWLPGEAYEYLRDKPGGKVLERYSRPGRTLSVIDEVVRSWEKAVKYARQHPTFGGLPEVQARLEALLQRVQAHHWSGIAGQSQRMILEKLIGIGKNTGQVEVSASHRQLVEGTSRATRKPIAGGLKALERDGWIRLTNRGTRDRASSYLLNLDRDVQKTPLSHNTPLVVMTSGVFCTHDLFARGGGLGVSAARVYAVLVQSPGPLSTAKIVAATHLKPRTVQIALRALADPRRNLAVKTSDGWICGPADIDELAQHRGSTGKGAELKARHRAERLMFRGHEAGSRVHIVKAAPQRKRCTGTTQAGAPCRAWARHDSAFCVHHEPKPIVVAPPMVVHDVVIEIPSQRQAGTEDRRQRHIVEAVHGPG